MRKMWFVLLLVGMLAIAGVTMAAGVQATRPNTQTPINSPVPADMIQALDQQSPCGNTWFNADASSLNWQQEVKTGVAGQLTSFDLYVYTGSTHVYINVGPTWQNDANDFDMTITATGDGWFNVDTSAANINLGAEEYFVIGVQGIDGGAGLCGDAFNGVYPRGRLFLNASEYVDYDLGFRSYMGDANPSTMHIGDLDGGARGFARFWLGGTYVTAHDQNHAPLAGVAITFDFPGPGNHTCTTDATGKCRVITLASNSTPNLTFTVTNAVKSGYTYDASANHDPDGDSNGTTITVSKPAQ